MFNIMDIAAIKKLMTKRQLREYMYQKLYLYEDTKDAEYSIHEACIRAFNIEP